VLVKSFKEFATFSEYELVVTGNYFFFNATDHDAGKELWQSDGTSNGTFMIQDLYPVSNNSDPRYITVFNNTLYFAATDKDHGRELFKYDLPLRIGDESSPNDLSLWFATTAPNPFTDQTSIKITSSQEDGEYTIFIYDVMGKKAE